MIDEIVTEFVDDTVDAQINQLNLPIDSFRVSFDEQELVLYNYDLFEQAYSGKRKEDLRNAGVALILDSILVSGINWKKLYLDSILQVKKILARSNEINTPKWIIDSLSVPSFTQIKSFEIGRVEIEIQRAKISDEYRTRLSEILIATSISINSDSISINNSINVKSWEANTNRISKSSIDGLHNFSIDRSIIVGNAVTFSGLRFKSKYNAENLGAQGIDRNTIFDITVPSTNLGLKDVLSFIRDSRLDLLTLEVKQMKMEIYTDLGIARKKERRLVHNFIKELPISLSIGQVYIVNSAIALQIDKPGFARNTLQFSSFDAVLSNFSNDTRKLKKNNTLSISLTSKLFRRVPLSLVANFDMTDPRESYVYRGSLGAMNLTELSPLLTAMKGMKIKEGKLISLDWDVSANSTRSSGWLDFEYDDFKMAQNNKKGIKDMDLLKFVATKLLVSSNNLHGQYFVRGDVSASRSSNQSMFFHMWESIYSGIESTLKP